MMRPNLFPNAVKLWNPVLNLYRSECKLSESFNRSKLRATTSCGYSSMVMVADALVRIRTYCVQKHCSSGFRISFDSKTKKILGCRRSSSNLLCY